ncbi:MAG: LysR family transcriptional regulator [Pseudomonadota bacterium]
MHGFAARAILESARAAAQELDRTHDAVSKQLQTLGVELFNRPGSGLRSTALGLALSVEVGEALSILAEVTEQTRHNPGRPILSLGISATFAFCPRYRPRVLLSQRAALTKPARGKVRSSTQSLGLFLALRAVRNADLAVGS